MFTLSSNNESLIETEKKKTPKFPVCLQCNSLCPLLIDYTIPTKITFKCPCGNEEKKVPWFKKLFKNKTNIDNYLRGYSLRIFPNQEVQDVTVFDIYENQINVLKIAFRL